MFSISGSDAKITEVQMTQTTQTSVAEKTEIELKEPSMYVVVYLNDSETAMQFVVETLIKYFDHTMEAAYNLTQEVHEKGSAIVGTYPYEIAEQKGVEVTLDAKRLGYPLQVKVEEA